MLVGASDRPGGQQSAQPLHVFRGEVPQVFNRQVPVQSEYHVGSHFLYSLLLRSTQSRVERFRRCLYFAARPSLAGRSSWLTCSLFIPIDDEKGKKFAHRKEKTVDD
jgi:hypothetical protein